MDGTGLALASVAALTVLGAVRPAGSGVRLGELFPERPRSAPAPIRPEDWPWFVTTITYEWPKRYVVIVRHQATEIHRYDEIVASWTFRTRGLAERMKRAIDAGKVVTDPKVLTDAFGHTYLTTNKLFFRSPNSLALQRLGF